MENRISQAIIMRSRDLGEADLLVTFFTPDQGCLKGVAKTARRSRRRFPNCLDLFCLTRMEYGERPRGDLHTLVSCRLLDGFDGLRRDFDSLALASYVVEVVEMLSPPHAADPLLFELLLEVFRLIDGGADKGHVRLFFEAAAMALGGYAIDLGRCGSCGRVYQGEGRAAFEAERGAIVCLKCGTESRRTPGLDPAGVQALGLLQTRRWEAFSLLDVSLQTARSIGRVNRSHMDYRLGRRPKSITILGE